MTDISHPTVHGHFAALVNHPAYHSLYGIYADYRVNNALFNERENQARLQKLLRQVQPLLWRYTPYRKSFALRLFTERQSLERFPAHKAQEAWRELKELIERIGPPPGWMDEDPRQGSGADAKDESAHHAGEGKRSGKKNAHRWPDFPKSPVDYDQEV